MKQLKMLTSQKMWSGIRKMGWALLHTLLYLVNILMLFLLLFFVFYIPWSARSDGKVLHNVEIQNPLHNTHPRQLVVLVHGGGFCPNQNVQQFGLPAALEQSGPSWCDMLQKTALWLLTNAGTSSPFPAPSERTIWQLVRDTYPDAAILIPRYNSTLFSNEDPFQLSVALEFAIRAADERDHYHDIILIGTSAGSLIARKAYLYGMGIDHDHPALPNAQSDVAYRKPWAEKVSRIVFASGVTRGWNPDAKPERITFLGYWLNKLFIKLGEWTNTARLVRNLERGTPFIANSRTQWIRDLPVALNKAHIKPPISVQLLGTIDDIVSADDISDLTANPGFALIPVSGAGHLQVLRFDNSLPGQAALRAFSEAIQLPSDELLQRYGKTAISDETAPKSDIVFIMHGIRDIGDWEPMLREALKDSYRRAHGSSPANGNDRDHVLDGLEIRTDKYGYFPMIPFLLLGER